MEELITDILLSASLCADCFAVALCSSVTMKKVTLAQVLKIALIFAIIQTSFLFVGWAFGDFIARYLMHFVKWIGMGLLVFVGVSMIREAFFHLISVQVSHSFWQQCPPREQVR